MLSSPLSGVNGVYVARMDYQDIAARKPYKGTEMFWAPSPSLPNQGGVLGFLPYWYYAPNGACQCKHYLYQFLLSLCNTHTQGERYSRSISIYHKYRLTHQLSHVYTMHHHTNRF